MPLKAIASLAKTFALTSLRCDALIGAAERIEQALLLSKAGIICLSGEGHQARHKTIRAADIWQHQNDQLSELTQRLEEL